MFASSVRSVSLPGPVVWVPSLGPSSPVVVVVVEEVDVVVVDPPVVAPRPSFTLSCRTTMCSDTGLSRVASALVIFTASFSVSDGIFDRGMIITPVFGVDRRGHQGARCWSG